MQTLWLGMAEDTKFIPYLPSSIQPSCGQRVGCYKPGCARNISNLSPRNAQGHVSCRKASRIIAITSNDGSSQGWAGLAGKLSLCCGHRGSDRLLRKWSLQSPSNFPKPNACGEPPSTPGHESVASLLHSPEFLLPVIFPTLGSLPSKTWAAESHVTGSLPSFSHQNEAHRSSEESRVEKGWGIHLEGAKHS